MGSPPPNYGRVKGICNHPGLAGDSRWGPSLGGRTKHNSYKDGKITKDIILYIQIYRCTYR